MTNVSDFDWAQVIHELQRPDGWAKGEFGVHWKPDGAVCVLGACMRVSQLATSFPYMDLLSEVVAEQFPERIPMNDRNCVIDFNDHPDTTLADVIAVVEKAAVKAGELA